MENPQLNEDSVQWTLSIYYSKMDFCIDFTWLSTDNDNEDLQ